MTQLPLDPSDGETGPRLTRETRCADKGPPYPTGTRPFQPPAMSAGPKTTVAYVVRYHRSHTETFVANEARGLWALGLRVRWFVLDEGPADLDALWPDEGAIRVPRPSSFRALWAASLETPQRHARDLHLRVRRPRDLRRAAWMARRFRQEGVHWCRLHFAAESSRLGLLAATMAGVPASLAIHGRDLFAPEPDLDAMVAAAADLSTVTQHHVATLRDRGAEARLVPCAAPPPVIRDPAPPATPLRLLTVGRLVEKKGHERTIGALAALRAAGHDATLDIIGEGPERPHLLALARGLPVAFHGSVEPRRVDAILRFGRWSAFVLACGTASDGDRDGLPVAALEAAAAGIPVVLSALPGFEDAFPGGVPVPAGQRFPSSEAVAAAILRLVRASESAGDAPPDTRANPWPDALEVGRRWWNGLPRTS